MSELSEEEILKILKEFNKIKINSYAMQFVNIPYPKLQEAIQGLLDLYNKEKEKNKSIEAQRLRDMCYKTDGNYISKDKIRGKIEKNLSIIIIGKRNGKIIDAIKKEVERQLLQELLEENNNEKNR